MLNKERYDNEQKNDKTISINSEQQRVLAGVGGNNNYSITTVTDTHIRTHKHTE